MQLPSVNFVRRDSAFFFYNVPLRLLTLLLLDKKYAYVMSVVIGRGLVGSPLTVKVRMAVVVS